MDFEIVPGREAVSRVMTLQATVPHRHAFMVGRSEELQYMEDALSFNERSPVEFIEAAAKIDLAAWQKQRFDGFAGDFAPDELEDFLTDIRGPWPDDGEGDEPMGFTIPTDILTGKPHPEVIIMMSPAPVARCWETFAHIKFGSFNDCPDPEIHVAFGKSWAEQFGARVMGVSHDTVEYSVSRPPETRAAAFALAEAQFSYCTDIVEQGMGTIENLAAGLLGSNYWYFWWD